MTSKRKTMILIPDTEIGLKMLGKIKIGRENDPSERANYSECKCCYTQCTRCSKCKVIDNQETYERITGW